MQDHQDAQSRQSRQSPAGSLISPSANPWPEADGEPSDMLRRIADLTRMLRDTMRELGLDQTIKEAAAVIPDARDRLRYVAHMTEQAAQRALTASEGIQPLQDTMRRKSAALDVHWQQWLAAPAKPEDMRALVDDTRAFLQETQTLTQATQSKVMEIIMAQDFQDLTGQVIMRMMDVVGTIERELLEVLLQNLPQERRQDADSLLNGPQVNPAGKPEVMTSQDQVDDLLASLGF